MEVKHGMVETHFALVHHNLADKIGQIDLFICPKQRTEVNRHYRESDRIESPLNKAALEQFELAMPEQHVVQDIDNILVLESKTRKQACSMT